MSTSNNSSYTCRSCEQDHDYSARPPCTSDNCWSCEENHKSRHLYEHNIPGPQGIISKAVKITDLDMHRKCIDTLNQIRTRLEECESFCNTKGMATIVSGIKPDICTLILKVIQKIDDVEDSQ